jgi:hypothetical protein
MSICERLRRSQRKSESPTEFELAVTDALAFLFGRGNVEHLGGPNKPDVKLSFGGKSVVFDAKSDLQGRVGDADPKWRVLQKYKQDYNSNQVVIVGESFTGGQIRRFAQEDSILLMKTDALCRAIEFEAEYPYNKDALFTMLFEGRSVVLSADDIDDSIGKDDVKILRAIWEILRKRREGKFSLQNAHDWVEGRTSEDYTIERIKGAIDNLVFFNIINADGSEYRTNHSFDEVEAKLGLLHTALKGRSAGERPVESGERESKSVPGKNGIPIFHVYKRREYKATFYRENGHVIYEAKDYGSPSRPASEITGTSINGWVWWQYHDEQGKTRPIDDFRKKDSLN